MGRHPLRQFLLVALVVTATACSDDGAISTTSNTLPSGGAVIVTLPSAPGTLTVNGAASFSFVTLTAGSITAKLTTLAPNTPVGLWIGVWVGSQCAFGTGRVDALQYDPTIPDNDPAQKGFVSAYATSGGNFCTRIYDPDGTGGVHTYQIEVSHP